MAVAQLSSTKGHCQANSTRMKELVLALLVLLCFEGSAQPASNEFEKELERLERQRMAERARSGSMEDREQAYVYFTRSLRRGDSSAQITEKLCPPWSARGTNYFVAEYPFSQWVPWTNRSLILEWQSNYELPNGRPRIVFALFSDAQKTNLVDALLYNGSEGVLPLLDGPYSRKVLAVKAGDNIEAVFRELGLRWPATIKSDR